MYIVKKHGVIMLEVLILLNILIVLIVLSSKTIVANSSKYSLYEIGEDVLTLTNEENQLEFAKLTNVLPANKYALSDPYFTTCENDLYDKSRCISANQLKKLNNTAFNEKYKKEINEVINKTLEEILLNPNTKEDDIVQKVDSLSEKIRLYN